MAPSQPHGVRRAVRWHASFGQLDANNSAVFRSSGNGFLPGSGLSDLRQPGTVHRYLHGNEACNDSLSDAHKDNELKRRG